MNFNYLSRAGGTVELSVAELKGTAVMSQVYSQPARER